MALQRRGLLLTREVEIEVDNGNDIKDLECRSRRSNCTLESKSALIVVCCLVSSAILLEAKVSWSSVLKYQQV